MDHNTKNHEIWTSRGLRIIFSEKNSRILNNLSLDLKQMNLELGRFKHNTSTKVLGSSRGKVVPSNGDKKGEM